MLSKGLERQWSAIDNLEKLSELAKKHAIWIRDVYSQQFEFQQVMPWPKANIFGIELPMCQFMECFNPKYASQCFENGTKMDIYLLDTLLKDYFVEGQEGFSFPIDDEVIKSKEKFEECLGKLYKIFPHLKEETVIA